MNKERKQRLTKNNVEKFLIWFHNPELNEKFKNYTSGKIREQYLKETGIDVSERFVYLKTKEDWCIIDKKPVKSYLVD